MVDADGDGYGDAIPSVAADLGSDCNDSNASVYPGYNNEIGNLCVLDLDGDGFGQINPPQPYDPEMTVMMKMLRFIPKQMRPVTE